MKQTIGVAMATWNGEHTMRHCMEALKGWVDEFRIVDGTSSDKTTEICKEYTDNVVITDNKPMIHTNKNMAIDAITSDWVLNLDQDEVITPKLKQEILDTINRDPQENGFWIPRSNYFFGHFMKKGGTYPDNTIRLYRRGKGRLGEVSIHEQATIDGEVGFLHHPMLHLSYPSITQYLAKFNKFTTIIAQDMESGKEKVAKPEIIQYLFIKPFVTFFKIYFRHRGYVDGLAGYAFALLSGLTFTIAYVKYWERKRKPEFDLPPKDWQ